MSPELDGWGVADPEPEDEPTRKGLAERVRAGVGGGRVAGVDSGDPAGYHDALGVAEHHPGVGEDLLGRGGLAEPQRTVAEVLDRGDRAALLCGRRACQRAEPHA